MKKINGGSNEKASFGYISVRVHGVSGLEFGIGN